MLNEMPYFFFSQHTTGHVDDLKHSDVLTPQCEKYCLFVNINVI